jgi:hypothetical protein
VTVGSAATVVGASPGGCNEALHKMSVPAERMDAPTDADTVTYANADLTDTIKVFQHYGVRLLTADEIRTQMPEYPLSWSKSDIWYPVHGAAPCGNRKFANRQPVDKAPEPDVRSKVSFDRTSICCFPLIYFLPACGDAD